MSTTVISNWHLHDSYIKELEIGDVVVLDPIYGREQIIALNWLLLSNGVKCAYILLARKPHMDLPSSKTNSRFVVRAINEPAAIIKNDISAVG